MRKGSSRRRVVAAAALATAIAAVLVPSAATTAAPEPSPAELRELRFKLADAIVDEERALELLRKKPPRPGTARLALNRAEGVLRDMLASGSFPGSDAVDSAAIVDRDAVSRLDFPEPGGRFGGAEYSIKTALAHKATAMAMLQQPARAQGPQCSDRVDNDGDGTVDARHDSGCSSAKDATENSALTCSLGYTAGTPVSVVQGTCSGPFANLELTAPTGVVFDTGASPIVDYARACRYASPRKLECVMSDGVANPRHRVRARFRYKSSSTLRPRVLIRDFAGRGRTWPVAAAQAPGAAGYLRFKLSYTHEGLSHVCASIEADSGASLRVSIEGPNGYAASGTLQLKKKEQKTAPGGFSFRIFEFGSYRVTIVSTAAGKSVTRTQTIQVTGAPGDSRCSATGAPPP